MLDLAHYRKQLRLFAAVFLFLLSSRQVLAQHDLGDGLIISDAQLTEIQKKLSVTTEEKTFYHWADSRERALRLGLQGTIDQGELDFLSQPTGDRQVYGGGLYVAEETESSKGFGQYLLEVKVKKGTSIYDESTVSKIVGTSLNNNQLTKLASLIPMIRKAAGTWWVVGNQGAIAKTNLGSLGLDPLKISTQEFEDPLKIKQILTNSTLQNNPHAQELKKIIGLTYYIDGSSLQAAVLGGTDNLVDTFEPKNFSTFQNAFENAFENAETLSNKTPLVSGDGKVFGLPGLSAEQWADSMIDQLIETNKQLGGTGQFRNEGIRVSGPGAKPIAVRPDMYLAYEANPYLSVNLADKQPSPSTLAMTYDYPDVFHVPEAGVSKEMLAEIKSHSADDLFQKSHSKRNSLNQKLIRDLLKNAFLELHGKPVNHAILQKRIVSIHPFADFNGRSSRIFSYVRGGAKYFPWESEFDLLWADSEIKPAAKVESRRRQMTVYGLAKALAQSHKTGSPPNFKDPVHYLVASDFSLSFKNGEGIQGKQDFSSKMKERSYSEDFAHQELRLPVGFGHDLKAGLEKLISKGFEQQAFDILMKTAPDAANPLEQVGFVRALNEYFGNSKNSKIRQLVVEKTSPVTLAIAELLDSKDEKIRKAAIDALEELKPRDPATLAKIFKKVNTQDTAEAKRAMKLFLKTANFEEGLKLLLANGAPVSKHHFEIRNKLIELHQKGLISDTHLKAIAKSLGSEDFLRRGLAANVFGAIPTSDPEIQLQLVEQLKGTSILYPKRALIKANPTNERVLLALARLLSVPENKDLHTSVLEVLKATKTANPEVHKAIAELLDSNNETIRKAAIDALEELKPRDPATMASPSGCSKLNSNVAAKMGHL
jgi:hypothetical protein